MQVQILPCNQLNLWTSARPDQRATDLYPETLLGYGRGLRALEIVLVVRSSATGTPSRDIRTAACPFALTQASAVPFQKCEATAAMNVATHLRPETGTSAARSIPSPNKRQHPQRRDLLERPYLPAARQR